MRANSLILVALLALAGFGAGLFIGGRLAATKASTAGSAATSPSDRLPAIQTRPKTAASDTIAGAPEQASLAEIEAALQKAIKMTSGRGYKALDELVKKVNPSDLPQLLAFVEKLPSANYRSRLRSMLLGRWAETDVSAAMAYANTVTGFQDRLQAISAVLGAWADKDAQAAAAWAQQLPPGQLRKQALSIVSGGLAQKDPEAAYALMTSSNRVNAGGA